MLVTTITGCGCDSKPEDVPLTGMPPAETRNDSANVEKIEFTDNDFNDSLTWMSASGVKKLSDFTKYVKEKYGYDLRNVNIDIMWGDEDTERKRRKARVIFGEFSYVYSTTSGICLTEEYIIAGKIANTLDREFNFTNRERR